MTRQLNDFIVSLKLAHSINQFSQEPFKMYRQSFLNRNDSDSKIGFADGLSKMQDSGLIADWLNSVEHKLPSLIALMRIQLFNDFNLIIEELKAQYLSKVVNESAIKAKIKERIISILTIYGFAINGQNITIGNRKINKPIDDIISQIYNEIVENNVIIAQDTKLLANQATNVLIANLQNHADNTKGATDIKFWTSILGANVSSAVALGVSALAMASSLAGGAITSAISLLATGAIEIADNIKGIINGYKKENIESAKAALRQLYDKSIYKYKDKSKIVIRGSFHLKDNNQKATKTEYWLDKKYFTLSYDIKHYQNNQFDIISNEEDINKLRAIVKNNMTYNSTIDNYWNNYKSAVNSIKNNYNLNIELKWLNKKARDNEFITYENDPETSDSWWAKVGAIFGFSRVKNEANGIAELNSAPVLLNFWAFKN